MADLEAQTSQEQVSKSRSGRRSSSSSGITAAGDGPPVVSVGGSSRFSRASKRITMGSILSSGLGLHGAIPPALGPHRNVGILRLRIPGSTYAQIFYPALPDAENTHTWPEVKYYREAAVKGLANFVEVPYSLMSNLVNVKHPFLLNAEIEPSEEPYPLVMFSHGLGGSAEMYSKVCMDMASLGFVVVALEHEDGTASYSQPENLSSPLPYTGAPKGFPYERDGVINFRRPFLDHRMAEVSTALEFMRNGSVEEAKMQPLCEQERLQDVFDMMNKDEFWLSGHSFGGTSTTYASCQPWAVAAKGIILFDVWPFPIPKDIVKHGFVQPVLSIVSEEFYHGKEIDITLDLLEHSSSPHTYSFYIPGTRHQQFSDFAFAMRGLMFRVAKVAGSQPPEKSQAAIFAALQGFMTADFEDDSEDARHWAKDAVFETVLKNAAQNLL